MLKSRMLLSSSSKPLPRFNHSSSMVRKQFLDFFKEKDHKMVCSSPVVPFNDPSLVFVNAGMNQFKSFLQNRHSAPYPRVTNTQKCIRVGGKHNDLKLVGHDGSHLTMFEMLGSWSFGDYWKQEACSLAWDLLVNHYRLDPKRLFVTYFGGCHSSGLPPDLEARDVWLSLGVPDSHILPFGLKDNFWEMGASGPCGPCTEIHYDHGGKGGSLVNAGTDQNLEIWNIVFVEYERSLDGSLSALDVRHIDTGLGLERLVSVLNNSNSSFDTDLFSPLFKGIHKASKVPEYSGKFCSDSELDTAYRILADHARMITVCLGDRVFPDQNHKLKYAMRKAFNISNETFGVERGMLQELYHYVAESLGETFPEIVKNEKKIKMMLDFEEESYKKLLTNSKTDQLRRDFPIQAKSIYTMEANRFYNSLQLLEKEGVTVELGAEMGFRLYERYGMQEDDIAKLAQLVDLNFNVDEFNKYFDHQKMISKMGSASQAGDMKDVLQLVVDSEFPITDDSFKYLYTVKDSGEYQFEPCSGRVVGLISGGNSRENLQQGEEGVIFLDRTNMYGEAGGQVGDKGVIQSEEGGRFEVENTRLVGTGLVAHMGRMTHGSLTSQQTVLTKPDAERRFRCMQNHSATHALNAALQSLLPITCQKSSLVTPDFLRFEFAFFKSEIDLAALKNIESHVLELIQENRVLKRTEIDSEGLLSLDNLVTLPGEVYPDRVSLIDLGTQVEPCCGTHLASSADILNFVIVSCKTSGTGSKVLKCLTGDAARRAREHGVLVCEDIIALQKEIEHQCDEVSPELTKEAQDKVSAWKKVITGPDFPVVLNMELSEILDKYQTQLRLADKRLAKDFIRNQMEQAIEDQKDNAYFVHVLKFDVKHNVLMSAAKMVRDKPCLILLVGNGELKGKAMVPKKCANVDFDARIWLCCILSATEGQGVGQVSKGYDPTIHYNIKVANFKDDQIIEEVVTEAIKLAEKYLKKES